MTQYIMCRDYVLAMLGKQPTHIIHKYPLTNLLDTRKGPLKRRSTALEQEL